MGWDVEWFSSEERYATHCKYFDIATKPASLHSPYSLPSVELNSISLVVGLGYLAMLFILQLMHISWRMNNIEKEAYFSHNDARKMEFAWLDGGEDGGH